MAEGIPNPYLKRRIAYQDAVREFRHFLEDAPTLAHVEIDKIKRALPLKHFNSFYARRFENTFQVWFGSHPTGRRNHPCQGKFPVDSLEPASEMENGGYLVYSLGPAGHVAIFLYPARSTAYRAREDFIILSIKRLSGYRLKQRLSRDLGRLVAYTHVTSLDGDPLFLEKMRIAWIRLTCRIQLDGEQTVHGKVYSAKVGDFVARSAMMALLKPIAVVLVLAVLLTLGWTQIAALISR